MVSVHVYQNIMETHTSLVVRNVRAAKNAPGIKLVLGTNVATLVQVFVVKMLNATSSITYQHVLA